MPKYADMLEDSAATPPVDKYNAMLEQGPLDFISTPTSNVSPVNDPSKMAGAGTQAAASLPTDMKERASYFAKQRFPNDPNGVARYGIQDGRLFYLGDDGKAYFEEPSFSASPEELAKYAASSAGPALPIAGSIAGGVASSPMGGIPGAGLGAASGDQLRQWLAMYFSGQQDFKPSQTAEEAGIGMLGQGIGAATIKFSDRAAARDIAKALTPEAKARQDYLSQAANEFGISLTPAEKTGLPSLAAQQNILGSLPESADQMGQFYTKRNTEEVPQGVEQFLGKLSPVESYEVGAQRLQKGAADALGAADKARSAVSSPIYKQAFQNTGDVDTAPLLQSIDDRLSTAKGEVATALQQAKKLLQTTKETQGPNGVSMELVPDTRLNALHEAQQALRDMADKTGPEGLGRTARREIRGVRDQLIQAMEAASPDYQKARLAHRAASPQVTALSEGEVGLAAEAGSTNLDRIPKLIFESGPNSVKQNRTAFVKAGREQEWNDGLRSYLQSAFDKAAKEFKSGNANPGASFRASVFGTNRQKAAMREAMTPEQWAGFNRLMDVLEASGKVPQGGSRTAFAQEGINRMKKDAAGVLGLGAKIINPSNILDTGRIAKAYGEIKMGRHAEQLANIVTSPDGMQQLKALRKLQPNSERAREIVSQLLTQYGVNVDPPDTQAGGL